MMKAFRKVKETYLPGGEDAEAKKHIQEIRDASTTLTKTLTFWYKTHLDHAANTLAVHEDMANLYPANEALSVAVAKLNNSAAPLQEANGEVDEVKRTFEPAIAELLARLAALTEKANERAVARKEIEHYKEKIVKLANEGLMDAKKQVKAESNQAKLLENQTIFKAADELLTVSIGKLDGDIASLTNAALQKFMSLQAKHAHALLGIYTASLDAIGVPGASPAVAALEAHGAAVAEAAAGGGGADADAEPAAHHHHHHRSAAAAGGEAETGGAVAVEEDASSQSAPPAATEEHAE